MYRIGHGFDVHRLAEGESLWLGGVKIEHTKGTVAHSDGDVLIHAICDALLGALNLNDIGYHFPDTDSEFKNIDSKKLLKKTYQMVLDKGYRIVNIDSTVCAEKPKLKPHIPEIKSKLREVLNLQDDTVSVKATTTEKLGFVGKEEGISVHAVVLLTRED